MVVFVTSCSNSVHYTNAIKAETSGRYLYNPDAVIDVFYKDDHLFLNWRGAEIKPVALDEHSFFVPDMYQKLRFLKHPNTKTSYLAIIPENAGDSITYAYEKVSDTFNTPSMHLENKNYEAALQGFLAIRKQDSTSVFINEREFNSMGYEFLRDKKYGDAISIFKLNTALHPDSDNAYDSLADGYLTQGDSLLAFTHYKKALELNPSNKRAKKFVSAYETKVTH
ncbi:tetratricopeptide repeat protein [Bizionia algoritergicola]|uniref:Tetratricopeptide repeat protein n=1 Tax=Bizionia algoritergicola TaxID=291187 RepID=A0A5D0QRC3_9FLAO|nr:tetratricopeptide repeat protein [Bizionia algoritergicola]